MQREYYTVTAAGYDAMHGAADYEHDVALRYMAGLARQLRIASLLDVGCGTGRATIHFRTTLPQVRVIGAEPVKALIEQGRRRKQLQAGQVVQASGDRLPFPDASFDAVCEIGVLHHVREPNILVREMMRVATKAVFLSDYNRFGHGSSLARLSKLGLWISGLWGAADRVRTLGKGYSVSEGDGLWYSYSVYDSFDLLDEWATRMLLIPTRVEATAGRVVRWCHPLLTSSHVLLCAIREG